MTHWKHKVQKRHLTLSPCSVCDQVAAAGQDFALLLSWCHSQASWRLCSDPLTSYISGGRTEASTRHQLNQTTRENVNWSAAASLLGSAVEREGESEIEEEWEGRGETGGGERERWERRGLDESRPGFPYLLIVLLDGCPKTGEWMNGWTDCGEGNQRIPSAPVVSWSRRLTVYQGLAEQRQQGAVKSNMSHWYVNVVFWTAGMFFFILCINCSSVFVCYYLIWTSSRIGQRPTQHSTGLHHCTVHETPRASPFLIRTSSPSRAV